MTRSSTPRSLPGARDRQFVIVNNGMTDLRGHYFENAVAVAEAAAGRGFRVAIAGHADCDLSGAAVPPGLAVVPAFRMNHWGNRLSAPLAAEIRAAAEPPPEPAPAPVPAAGLRSLAKAVLPGWVARPARGVFRLRHYFASGGTHHPHPNPPPSRGRGQKVDGVETSLRAALDAFGFGVEADLSRAFLHDLAGLLDRLGVGPGDHVYLPTAHGREALAVRRLVADRGPLAPTFHLEFRHAIASRAELAIPSACEKGSLLELSAGVSDRFTREYSAVHAAYFDAVAGYPPAANVRYYTDTPELAADYAAFAGRPFEVLPIPFRVGLFPQKPPRTPDTLTVLYLGDARREKGFDLLPRLVRELYESHVRPGRVRFVIQATLHPDEADAELTGVIAELAGYPAGEVELVGRGRFLPGEEYYALLAAADVVLCPYRADAYRSRSSGVLAEAILAGIPAVVPAGTWLAGVLPPGSGEAFADAAGLSAAVRAVCDGYPAYRAAAAAARPGWQAVHTPANLVARLVGLQPLTAAA